MIRGIRLSIVAGALTALSFGNSFASAGSASANYVANGASRVSGSVAGHSVGVGGFQFTPTGDPSTIKVLDTIGTGVEFDICQELPGTDGEVPGTCGDGDDVDQAFCSRSSAITLSTAFRANIAVTVFVSLVPGLYGVNCENPGTTGIITLAWV